MNSTIKEITERENSLYRKWGGNIPEACGELNDLQREKIKAIYSEFGTAYIGKINPWDSKNLTLDNALIEYKGEFVYNFDADFIIPTKDDELAKMLVDWISGAQNSIIDIENIVKRIDALNGANLIWS